MGQVKREIDRALNIVRKRNAEREGPSRSTRAYARLMTDAGIVLGPDSTDRAAAADTGASGLHPVFAGIVAGFFPGLQQAAPAPKEAHKVKNPLDELDLGDLRRFEIDEEDARDAFDRLVTCDRCRRIGDAGDARRGALNQDDGTVPHLCYKCQAAERVED